MCTTIVSAYTRSIPNSEKPLSINARETSVAYPLFHADAMQAVPEFGLQRACPFARPEVKPAEELAGSLLDDGPEAEAFEAVVVAQEGRKRLLDDLLAAPVRRR